MREIDCCGIPRVGLQVRVARLYTVNRFCFAQRALSFLGAHFLEYAEILSRFDNIFLKALYQSFSENMFRAFASFPSSKNRGLKERSHPRVCETEALYGITATFFHNRTRRPLGNELLYLGLELMHVCGSITVKSLRTAHTPGGGGVLICCLS